MTLPLIEPRHAKLLSLLNNRYIHFSLRFGMQILLSLVAGVFAFLLRFDFAIPASSLLCLAWALAVGVTVRPLVLHAFGATGFSWRYFSTPDLLRLLAGHLAGAACMAILLLSTCPVPFPHSILLIDPILALSLGAGIRVATRLFYELSLTRQRVGRHRTLVCGAGRAGILLLTEARQNPSFPYEICGFVDDAKHKGIRIQGVRVLGTGADLPRLVAEHNIDQVLIAIPSATNQQMSRMTAHCQAAGVNYKTMPPLSEIMSGRPLITQIRDVAVEDLLGRSAAQLEDNKIRLKIEGRVVLVSGAAGSIGSELCRQIARFRPHTLVAFDISETALFFLDRELKEKFPELNLQPEIGSIQNVQRLREVFGRHLPTLVIHAAAYKHVPLMEKHFFEAVENNVFGTFNLAQVSADYAVQDFVMISSDKAVNPTNVMGTTKRVAELLIRSFKSGGPRYVSVRFGNVLGSNGSVVPIFNKQIAEGGPITITHPDIERYFMTIPEASQLVLQACTMGRGGEIFVLEMGKPVKIVDLARQLIRLSGLRPDTDIRIEFTGLRPGEKLYEEISLSDEQMLPTHHSKIKVFAGKCLPAEAMNLHLQRLKKACEQRDERALIRELESIVPEYMASKDLVERVFTDNLANLGNVLHFAASVESESLVHPHSG